MSPREKFISFIKRLHRATIKGGVGWTTTFADPSVFEATVVGIDVKLRQDWNSDAAAPDYYVAIYNSDRILMEESSDVQLSSAWRESYAVMNELYQAARAKATGADAALDALNEALGPEPQDEIPF